MIDVLVVDDSAVDRKLAGGLLEQGGLAARFAENGPGALELLEESPADVVLIDLVMPDMDGLELVENIRRDHPGIPTILMTSRGNEGVAVKALKRGAASYVPKRLLNEALVSTIQHVLELSDQARHQHRLMAYMTESSCRFKLDNDRSLIPSLVGHVQSMVARARLCDESDQTRIGIALDEALVNAVYHGNLELSSEMREHDSDEYYNLAEERRQRSPYQDRNLYVDITISHERAVFKIQDEGPGFDPATLPDPTDPNNLENVCGRGILLMRTFMDDVMYSEDGTCVRMVKNRNNSNIE